MVAGIVPAFVGLEFGIPWDKRDLSIDIDDSKAAIAVNPIMEDAATKIIFGEDKCFRENLLCIAK